MSARRVRAVLVLSALVLGVAACTAGKAGDNAPTTTASQTGGGRSPQITVGTTPGSYRFTDAGLTATVKLTGSTGTLQIDNRTGRTLAQPDLYILDARDGSRIEVDVDGAAPIRNGETASFAVAVRKHIELKNIGWVDLLIGPDDYGGFVQQ